MLNHVVPTVMMVYASVPLQHGLCRVVLSEPHVDCGSSRADGPSNDFQLPMLGAQPICELGASETPVPNALAPSHIRRGGVYSAHGLTCWT